MHPVLFYESFFFCSRNDLERLQPLSKSLRNIIVNGSKALPLRPVDRVFIMDGDPVDGDAMIQITVDNLSIYDAPTHYGDFTETFRRLQHTCIKWFDVSICDSPFLRYWMAQEAAVFNVVRIEFYIDFNGHYDIFDSIVNHARPKTTIVAEDGTNNELMKVLTRKSLLNSLRTCCLRVYAEGFPSSSFFLDEPGYAKYELWFHRPSAANWIDGFIESFVRDGCANKKFESVCVRWGDSEDHQSPAPKQLSKPTKREIPLPKMELTALLNIEVHPMTQCEVHSFVSTKHSVRMDVYKWSDYDCIDPPDVVHILQCRVSDL
ncbi:hypothetical protein AAVH_21064 [Aphelenchoides avenae]|nr:hypothetical protein AAVH_21064 [Aphelenchus avenae]